MIGSYVATRLVQLAMRKAELMNLTRRVLAACATCFVASAVVFAAVEPKQIADGAFFGCTTKAQHGKLVDYLVQGDKEAFTRALAESVVAGECTMFKKDELIYLTDTAVLSGLVKVRRKGETAEYWTNIEAVK
jgi:hypothetical protein